MAIEKTIVLKADTSQATKDIKKLDDNVKGIDRSSIGAKGGIISMSNATKLLGASLKATGIGLVIGLFVKLQEALSQNQVVMDTFNVVTESISITFQKLINTLVETTQKVVGFFGKVGEVIKTFVTQDLDGLENSYEKMSSASDKVEGKTKSLARQMVELRNEVKLAEAEQRLLQLTYQKEAELQRQIRDDVSLTMQERIAANNQLGIILNKQFEEEKAITDKKVLLAEMELSTNKGNIDLQVALTNSKTELAELDERITGQRSEQLTNLNALQKEHSDINSQAVEQEKAILLKNEPFQIEANNVEDRLALKRKENTELLNLSNKNAQEELKVTEDKIAMNKAMEISGAQSILGALGQLAGEGTKLAKATAVSSILINTAQGVSAAIKAGAGLVFPANLGAIATGVGAVLSGIASAKSILKKVPEGVDPPDTNIDTDIGSTDTTSLQEMNTGGLGGLIPNMNTIQPVSTTPIQAFVVENDISNAQALQEELDIQATL
tara:strand:- start:30 stop:1520 length:1491 start_codon:yes stop_codon:yes gene_type:complete